MRLKRVLAPTLLVALFASLLIQLPLAIADRTSAYEWFLPIQDIRHILLKRYVREPDEDAMQQAMIDAMLGVLDDPYTQYVPPRSLDDFNKRLRGTYAGIGAEVNIVDGYLVIVSPMDDSPALRAGVLAGDTVLEIEGEPTFDVPISTCVELLTGDVGTAVTILVRHLDGKEEPLTIIRDRIVTTTVRGLRRFGEAWSHCVDETLGLDYIRVTQFNDSTVGELREVLERLTAHGLGGLILDLRDNPGGGLEVAVEMADMFLSTGMIVSVRPRHGEELVRTAKEAGTLPGFPMIVVVNGNSASASEIVAGALQDNGRARVLGTRTFGKGSVQEVRSLNYGTGTLKFTTAHYYLPSGRNINRTGDVTSWGVDPDPGLVVSMTDKEYLEAFRARREFEIIRKNGDGIEACVPPGWLRESLHDEQLASAAEALRTRVTEGDWPAVSDEESGLTAFNQELKRAATARVRLLERVRQVESRIDELERGAEAEGREPLLPPEAELAGGTISVLDREGNHLGTFRIEGGDVARALDSLTVRRVGE